MRELSFIKMQGLGNDFIVIDHFFEPSDMDLNPSFAKKICDRKYGVGADQVLWLKKPQNSVLDVRMDILNADGSVAEMCGNGIRAVALYLDKKHRQAGKIFSEYRIETLAGEKRVKVQGALVTVDMGLAQIGEVEKLKVQDQIFDFYEVNMGNPHAVIFVDNDAAVFAEKWGPLIEKNPRFPKRTNVEFVEIKNSNRIVVRVWERGAGLTLACGTGACASAVASLATGKVNGKVTVELPGGNLLIQWNGPQSSVFMEGPGEEVFKGIFYLD